MAQRSKAILRSAGRIALWTLVISTLIGVGLGIGRLLVQINRNPKVLGDILGDVLGGVMGMVVVVLIVMWAFLWLLFPVFVYVRLGRLIELQERVVRALERKP